MQLCSVAKRKRAFQALYRKEAKPKDDEFICLVLLKSKGNYLFSAITGSGEEILVSIPERFRNAFYFTPDTYTICIPLDNVKVRAEIVCLLDDHQVLELSASSDWPKVFSVRPSARSDNKCENYLDVDMLPTSEEDDESEEEESEHDDKDVCK
uniref:Probable RNA-binding protein EIF1AD n=1 Tax=Mesocestoides corti TaxID=53468 RepID=A0A5K3EWG4_MESCO